MAISRLRDRRLRFSRAAPAFQSRPNGVRGCVRFVVDCHRNAALKDADFVGEDVEDRLPRRVWHAVEVDADGLIIPSCAGRRSRRNIAYRAHSARLAKDTFSSAKASLTTRQVWHAPRIVMVSSRWRACAERRRSPPERRYKSEELFADPDGQRSAHRSAVSSRTPSRAARWCA